MQSSKILCYWLSEKFSFALYFEWQFKFVKIDLLLIKKRLALLKKHHQSWRLSYNTFWPKWSMRKSVYQKLCNSQLSRNCRILYFDNTFEKGLKFQKPLKNQSLKETRIIRNKNLFKQIILNKKYEQNKETNHNWIRTAYFDYCFCIFFGRYHKRFISGKETGD